MISACRSKLSGLSCREAFDHAGLALARYLPSHAAAELQPEEKGEKSRPEVDLLESACGSRMCDAYRTAFTRWKGLAGQRGDLMVEAKAAGSLAVGLGGESPFEVGLSIHHTYGAPFIPGSAIKGVCRKAATTLLDEGKMSEDQFRYIFGQMNAPSAFVFWDAWFDPGSVEGKPFHRDVITVHHPKYYSSQGKDVWPTDFDDPTPVPFLVVRAGARFLFSAQCPNDEWRAYLRDLLGWTLKNVGVGGKTNAGYGHFQVMRQEVVPPVVPETDQVEWRGVAVRRTPNNGELETVYGADKAFARGKEAQSLFASLPASAQDQLKSKKHVIVADVRVETDGNSRRITRIVPQGGIP